MKIRIAALVFLCVALMATTFGAVAVGIRQNPVTPSTSPQTGVTKEPVTTGENTEPLTTENNTVETAPVTDEYVPRENHVSFAVAGDNLVLNQVRRYANILAGGSGDPTQYNAYGFSYSAMYDSIKPILKKTDLAFYNQDSIVFDDTASNSMTTSLGEDMTELGFNIVNIANNAMLEKGEEGLLSSIDYWKKKPVALLGGNLTADTASSVTVIEKNNITIAFLSYTYGVDDLPTDENGAVKSDLVYPIIDKDRISREVTAAKDMADMVFVYLHWGAVGDFNRNADQSEVAQLLVDLKVDAIFGSHPNVIQEMKWKQRPDGGKTLICYSLGNLLSAMPYANNLLGGLVTFDIDKDENGKCTISNVLFNPLFTHYDENYKSISIRLLKDYTQADLDTHGSSILKGKSDYGKLVEKLKTYIPKSFLDEYFASYSTLN